MAAFRHNVLATFATLEFGRRMPTGSSASRWAVSKTSISDTADGNDSWDHGSCSLSCCHCSRWISQCNIKVSLENLCCASWRMPNCCHACLPSSFPFFALGGLILRIRGDIFLLLFSCYTLNKTFHPLCCLVFLSPQGWLVNSCPSCMRRE